MEEGAYGAIRYTELQSIIQSSNKTDALLLLAFIRLNTYKRSGRQPEMYFCHLRDLPSQLGLSLRAITESIKTLSSLGLIHCEEQPRYQDKHGNWHSGLYLFIDKEKYKNGEVDQSYDWREQFKLASLWLSNEQANHIELKNSL